MSSFWTYCLNQFEQELPEQQFKTWLLPLRLEGEESPEKGLNIIVPTIFKLNWIKERYLLKIEQLAASFFSTPVEIKLILNQKEDSNYSKEALEQLTKKNIEIPKEKQIHLNKKSKKEVSLLKTTNPVYKKTKLVAEYTFENLVSGKANNLACAAALQVAQNVGVRHYNPLFIYGGAGLGKTHLIHAIGNKILDEDQKKIIRYVHAEDYIQSYISAIKSGSFDNFTKFYRSLDVFLLDDVQFFNRKEGSQNELFFVFNTLIQEGKQIIITCDTYPKDISGLGDRLITRFDWGLTVQLEPPELEMRVAILKKKAEFANFILTDEISFFIAKHLKSNVRELEGALNKVIAYSSFHQKKIDLELAKNALKDIIGAVNKQISITDIQTTVADYFKIKVSDLFSKKRTRQIARPRQIAMWLAKSLTQNSYPSIGENFGGRDHTTVLHAIKTIDKLRINDQIINHDVHFLLQSLKD